MNENEQLFPIELFGLKAKDGSEWKLIMNGYGTNWVEVKPVYKRPPLGIKPKYIYDKERIDEIKNAIRRYIDAGIEVPKEWTDELMDLFDVENKRLLNRYKNDSEPKAGDGRTDTGDQH